MQRYFWIVQIRAMSSDIRVVDNKGDKHCQQDDKGLYKLPTTVLGEAV